MDYNVKEDLPFPPVLRIEPAATCNFRCIHCPTGIGLAPKGIMAPETFDAIFEKIKKYRFRAVVLYHGGEPLLNRNFFNMVRAMKPLTQSIKVNTNGSLLNDDNIEMLLDSGIDRLVISLDGLSPEENNEIRRGCDFEKVITSLKKLLRLKVERNITTLGILIGNVQIKDSNNPRELKPPQYILDELEEFKGHFNVYGTFWAYLWPELPVVTPDVKPENNFCDSVVNTFTIRWNGDVVPCCNDLTSKMVMGNALREDVEAIWNNEKYKKLRYDIQNFNPPELCRSCYVLFPAKLMDQSDLAGLKSVRK
jgi:radical SAM protein with 4Fe4S-binding SPASM domain